MRERENPIKTENVTHIYIHTNTCMHAHMHARTCTVNEDRSKINLLKTTAAENVFHYQLHFPASNKGIRNETKNLKSKAIEKIKQNKKR